MRGRKASTSLFAVWRRLPSLGEEGERRSVSTQRWTLSALRAPPNSGHSFIGSRSACSGTNMTKVGTNLPLLSGLPHVSVHPITPLGCSEMGDWRLALRIMIERWVMLSASGG